MRAVSLIGLLVITACGGEEEGPCPFSPGTYRVTGVITYNTCNSITGAVDPLVTLKESLGDNLFGIGRCGGRSTVSDMGCRVDFAGSCEGQGSVPPAFVGGFVEWVAPGLHTGSHSFTYDEVVGIRPECTVEIADRAERL